MVDDDAALMRDIAHTVSTPQHASSGALPFTGSRTHPAPAAEAGVAASAPLAIPLAAAATSSRSAGRAAAPHASVTAQAAVAHPQHEERKHRHSDSAGGRGSSSSGSSPARLDVAYSHDGAAASDGAESAAGVESKGAPATDSRHNEDHSANTHHNDARPMSANEFHSPPSHMVASGGGGGGLHDERPHRPGSRQRQSPHGPPARRGVDLAGGDSDAPVAPERKRVVEEADGLEERFEHKLHEEQQPQRQPQHQHQQHQQHQQRQQRQQHQQHQQHQHQQQQQPPQRAYAHEEDGRPYTRRVATPTRRTEQAVARGDRGGSGGSGGPSGTTCGAGAAWGDVTSSRLLTGQPPHSAGPVLYLADSGLHSGLRYPSPRPGEPTTRRGATHDSPGATRRGVANSGSGAPQSHPDAWQLPPHQQPTATRSQRHLQHASVPPHHNHRAEALRAPSFGTSPQTRPRTPPSPLHQPRQPRQPRQQPYNQQQQQQQQQERYSSQHLSRPTPLEPLMVTPPDDRSDEADLAQPRLTAEPSLYSAGAVPEREPADALLSTALVVVGRWSTNPAGVAATPMHRDAAVPPTPRDAAVPPTHRGDATGPNADMEHQAAEEEEEERRGEEEAGADAPVDTSAAPNASVVRENASTSMDAATWAPYGGRETVGHGGAAPSTPEGPAVEDARPNGPPGEDARPNGPPGEDASPNGPPGEDARPNGLPEVENPTALRGVEHLPAIRGGEDGRPNSLVERPPAVRGVEVEERGGIADYKRKAREHARTMVALAERGVPATRRRSAEAAARVQKEVAEELEAELSRQLWRAHEHASRQPIADQQVEFEYVLRRVRAIFMRDHRAPAPAAFLRDLTDLTLHYFVAQNAFVQLAADAVARARLVCRVVKRCDGRGACDCWTDARQSRHAPDDHTDPGGDASGNVAGSGNGVGGNGASGGGARARGARRVRTPHPALLATDPPPLAPVDGHPTLAVHASGHHYPHHYHHLHPMASAYAMPLTRSAAGRGDVLVVLFVLFFVALTAQLFYVSFQLTETRQLAWRAFEARGPAGSAHSGGGGVPTMAAGRRARPAPWMAAGAYTETAGPGREEGHSAFRQGGGEKPNGLPGEEGHSAFRQGGDERPFWTLATTRRPSLYDEVGASGVRSVPEARVEGEADADADGSGVRDGPEVDVNRWSRSPPPPRPSTPPPPTMPLPPTHLWRGWRRDRSPPTHPRVGSPPRPRVGSPRLRGGLLPFTN